LGIYVGINLLGALIVIFGSIIYLIYSLVRCCCCKPTPSTVPEDPKKRLRWEYFRIFVSVMALLGVPCVFLLTTFYGNYGISSSSQSLTSASAGAKNLIESMEPGLTGLFISSAATILAPTLANFNSTLATSVNVEIITGSLQDINTTVPRLPNIGRMVTSLEDISFIATDTCQIPLDNLVALADDLIDQNNQLGHMVDTLLGDVSKIKTASKQMLKSLSHGETALDEADTTMTTLFGTTALPVTDDTKGLLGVVKYDLKMIQRAPSGVIPTTTTFTASCDSSAGSVTELISGALNNSVSGLATMTGKLTTIYSNMSSLPNLTATAHNIIKINHTVASMVAEAGLLDQITLSLNAVTNNITAFPSLSPVYSHLHSLDTILHSFNISGAVAVMEVLYDIFGSLPPQLTILSKELEQIRLLNVVLPALETLTVQLRQFNTSIILLPSTLSVVYDAYDTINNTASEVMAQVNDIQDNIVSANETISGYLETLQDYIDLSIDEDKKLNDAINSYNLTDVLIEINATIATLADTNFTSILIQVKNFKSSLSSFSFPTSLSQSVFTLRDSVDAMNTLLKRGVDSSSGGKSGATRGDYLRLQQGYCANDESKDCSSDGDCSASSCVAKGSYRCTEKGSHRCSADATCSSGVSSSSYCLADTSRANSLKTYLQAFSSSSTVPSFTNEITELSSLQTATTFSLSSAGGLVDDANKALNSVNYTTIEGSLEDMKQAIKDYNMTKEATAIKETIQDTQQEITDIPLIDYIDLLTPFADDFQTFLDDQYGTLVDVTQVMQTLRNFIYSPGGLRARLAQFKETNLDGIVVSQGPSAMIDHIAYQFDLMSDYFTDTDLGLNAPNFTKKTGDEFNFLDKMGAYEVSGYGDMNENGPNYYLMRLFKNSETVLAGDNGLSGVFVNKGGERYPGGAYCTLDKCQEHTLDVVNTAPMNEWQDEFPGTDLSMFDSVTYSREELQLYIWGPTLLLWLIGLIAFISHFSVSKCGQTLEKYSAGCYLACICCQLPFIFILTALFFVLIVMLADGCDSYAVIGDSYITTYGDPFCHNVFGGNGTLAHCVIETDLPNYMTQSNFTVTIDILRMYRAIFENECQGGGPFLTVLDSIADQIVTMPRDYTSNLIDHINDNGNFVLRDPLINVALNGTGLIGTVVRDYLREQADTTLTCHRIAAVVHEMHTNTCGSMAPALLWSIGPWYLCAWILCCCSLPSACLLGRARKDSSVFPQEGGGGGGGGHRPLPQQVDPDEEEGGGGRGFDDDDEALNRKNQVAPYHSVEAL
jgi:hypothetical protein